MSVVNILLTMPGAQDFEPFIHGEATFQFSRLTSNGPQFILDGAVWVFIEWVLDDMSGLELCRRMRVEATTADAHITMVLDDDDPASRKRALDAGADDYLVGPIDRRKALDRVLALNPEINNRYSSDMMRYGPLTINLPAYRAYWHDTAIDLSPNEFRLLRFLAENANRTLSRREIVAGLGKESADIDDRTVDVWIGRLRKAIKSAGGGNPLRTIRLLGYVFEF